MTLSCRDCSFHLSLEYPAGSAYCHRYPPPYPLVNGADWCGEHLRPTVTLPPEPSSTPVVDPDAVVLPTLLPVDPPQPLEPVAVEIPRGIGAKPEPVVAVSRPKGRPKR